MEAQEVDNKTTAIELETAPGYYILVEPSRRNEKAAILGLEFPAVKPQEGQPAEESSFELVNKFTLQDINRFHDFFKEAASQVNEHAQRTHSASHFPEGEDTKMLERVLRIAATDIVYGDTMGIGDVIARNRAQDRTLPAERLKTVKEKRLGILIQAIEQCYVEEPAVFKKFEKFVKKSLPPETTEPEKSTDRLVNETLDYLVENWRWYTDEPPEPRQVIEALQIVVSQLHPDLKSHGARSVAGKENGKAVSPEDPVTIMVKRKDLSEFKERQIDSALKELKNTKRTQYDELETFGQDAKKEAVVEAAIRWPEHDDPTAKSVYRALKKILDRNKVEQPGAGEVEKTSTITR